MKLQKEQQQIPLTYNLMKTFTDIVGKDEWTNAECDKGQWILFCPFNLNPDIELSSLQSDSSKMNIKQQGVYAYMAKSNSKQEKPNK